MDNGIFGLAFFGYVWFLIVSAVYVGVLVLIALGLRWLVRSNDRKRDAQGGPADSGRPVDPALAALRERFARGEIDAEEFEQRRRVLGGPPG